MDTPFNFPMQLPTDGDEMTPLLLAVATRPSNARRGGVKVLLALTNADGSKVAPIKEMRLDMN